MTDFLHGPEVIEIDEGSRPIASQSQSIIGLCGTAPDSMAAAAATLLTGIEANDEALTWTAANTGAAGNSITVHLKNPLANSSSLVVAVSGLAITANLATDVGGLITTTATLLAAGIAAAPAAAALVAATNTGTSDGSGIVAPTSKLTNLTGGLDEAFPLDTPVTVFGSRVAAAKLGASGTLPSAIDGILDQTNALIVVVRVEEGVDAAATLVNIIGGADETGNTGVHVFETAESIVGLEPKILIAPGFTNDLSVIGELYGIADSLRAIIVADGTNTTDADIFALRTSIGSQRTYLVEPWLDVLDSVTQVVISEPPSARVAGVIAKSDAERGYWWSPSNRPIFGIRGPSRPISFAIGSRTSQANVFNASEITTVIRQDGFRLWGNRSCATDPKWSFINVRRTADAINDALERSHFYAIDRNITVGYVDAILESMNKFFRERIAEGAMVNASVWVDPELNTAESIQAGKMWFDFDFSLYPPAEHIIFRSHMINGYLVEIIELNT